MELVVLRECGPFGTAGVRSLSALPRLKWLDLRGCAGVTDECVPVLARMKSIEPGGLRLTGTRVSADGLRAIRASLGEASVDVDPVRWQADR
ncbi:hypothetical protein D3C83_44700 [compost metagenome]